MTTHTQNPSWLHLAPFSPWWPHLGLGLLHFGPTCWPWGPILGHHVAILPLAGPIMAHLFPSLGHLGPSVSHLGAILAPSAAMRTTSAPTVSSNVLTQQIFSISRWETFSIRPSVLELHILLLAHLAPVGAWKVANKPPELPPRPLCSNHAHPHGPPATPMFRTTRGWAMNTHPVQTSGAHKDGSLLSLGATIKHIGINATIKQPLNTRLMVRCLVFPSLIGT